eukprot:3608190-Rhodomonas_salina.4
MRVSVLPVLGAVLRLGPRAQAAGARRVAVGFRCMCMLAWQSSEPHAASACSPLIVRYGALTHSSALFASAHSKLGTRDLMAALGLQCEKGCATFRGGLHRDHTRRSCAVVVLDKGSHHDICPRSAVGSWSRLNGCDPREGRRQEGGSLRNSSGRATAAGCRCSTRPPQTSAQRNS